MTAEIVDVVGKPITPGDLVIFVYGASQETPCHKRGFGVILAIASADDWCDVRLTVFWSGKETPARLEADIRPWAVMRSSKTTGDA